MTHNVKEIVTRELSQMNWDNGLPQEDILHHFRMAPTVREMLEDQLPRKTYHSAADVMQALPDDQWQRVEDTIEHGNPESHYLQSRAAHFNIRGETPGFGHLPPEEHTGTSQSH